jgi:hypothetical protein
MSYLWPIFHFPIMYSSYSNSLAFAAWLPSCLAIACAVLFRGAAFSRCFIAVSMNRKEVQDHRPLLQRRAKRANATFHLQVGRESLMEGLIEDSPWAVGRLTEEQQFCFS